MAASRQAGLAQFQERSFDLTIVDYEMGHRHGDGLAAEIKTLDPNQPIALITAFAEALQAAGVPLAGVDLVISKPFGLDALRLAVTKLLTRLRGFGHLQNVSHCKSNQVF